MPVSGFQSRVLGGVVGPSSRAVLTFSLPGAPDVFTAAGSGRERRWGRLRTRGSASLPRRPRASGVVGPRCRAALTFSPFPERRTFSPLPVAGESGGGEGYGRAQRVPTEKVLRQRHGRAALPRGPDLFPSRSAGHFHRCRWRARVAVGRVTDMRQRVPTGAISCGRSAAAAPRHRFMELKFVGPPVRGRPRRG